MSVYKRLNNDINVYNPTDSTFDHDTSWKNTNAKTMGLEHRSSWHLGAQAICNPLTRSTKATGDPTWAPPSLAGERFDPIGPPRAGAWPTKMRGNLCQFVAWLLKIVHLQLIYLFQMVMFHSYVSLPRGRCNLWSLSWFITTLASGLWMFVVEMSIAGWNHIVGA